MSIQKGASGRPVHVVSGPCPTTPSYGVPAAEALLRSAAAARLAAALRRPCVETLPVADMYPSTSARFAIDTYSRICASCAAVAPATGRLAMIVPEPGCDASSRISSCLHLAKFAALCASVAALFGAYSYCVHV